MFLYFLRDFHTNYSLNSYFTYVQEYDKKMLSCKQQHCIFHSNRTRSERRAQKHETNSSARRRTNRLQKSRNCVTRLKKSAVPGGRSGNLQECRNTISWDAVFTSRSYRGQLRDNNADAYTCVQRDSQRDFLLNWILFFRDESRTNDNYATMKSGRT